MPRSRADATVALDDRICELMRQHHPRTVRQVYYRLVSLGLIDKTEKGYQKVIVRLTWLRKHGHIPFGWIIDPGRGHYEPQVYSDPGQLFQRYAGGYRTSPWFEANMPTDLTPRDGDLYWRWKGGDLAGTEVVVAVESRSLAAIVEPTCRRWCVPMFPFGGQPSLTLLDDWASSAHKGIAEFPQRLVRAKMDASATNDSLVLYIGDYDPAGLTIEETARRDLLEYWHAGARKWERLAITAEQAADLDAEGLSHERKDGEQRHPEVEYCVEAEAMDAPDIVELLEDRLAEVLPEERLDAVAADDRRVVERIREVGEIVSGLGIDGVLRVLRPSMRRATARKRAPSSAKQRGMLHDGWE